jgi:hypothetical protein
VRNPGGFGQLICDIPMTGQDRLGRVIGQEHDTLTCGHCGTVVFVNAGERPEDIGGFCRRCMKCICGPCVDQDRCRPIEQWLAQQEREIEDAIERRRLYWG